MRTTLLLLILITMMIGCSRTTVQEGGVSQTEYSIYSTIANEFLAKYQSVIIADSTIQKSRLAGIVKVMKSGEWVELDDWYSINYTWSDLDTRELRPSYEQQNIARSPLVSSAFQTNRELSIFHSQNPLKGTERDVLQDVVAIWFSRVAFNKAGTNALVYFEYFCGDLCGAGNWYLLSKQETAWTIVKRMETWVS